jgi:hypothetical protein
MLGSLVGLALAAGCRSKSKRTPHIRVEDFGRGESGDPIIRVACAGDSITYGAGVEDREKKCYPVRLNALLGPRFDVRKSSRLSGNSVRR